MKYLFFTLIAFSLFLSSCQSDMQGIELSAPEEMGQIEKNLQGHDLKVIDGVLADLNSLSSQLRANSNNQLKAVLSWSDEQIEKGGSVDFEEFLIERLNVSNELYIKIKQYSPDEIRVLEEELNAPEGNGPLSIRLQDGVNGPGSPGGPQARCSFRDHVWVVRSIIRCAISIDNIINGTFTVSGIVDDCRDAYYDVYMYVNLCILIR